MLTHNFFTGSIHNGPLHWLCWLLDLIYTMLRIIMVVTINRLAWEKAIIQEESATIDHDVSVERCKSDIVGQCAKARFRRTVNKQCVWASKVPEAESILQREFSSIKANQVCFKPGPRLLCQLKLIPKVLVTSGSCLGIPSPPLNDFFLVSGDAGVTDSWHGFIFQYS